MSENFFALFEGGTTLPLKKAGSLFNTGDQVRSMYLVRAGQIDLVRHTRAGARMILYSVLPGQVVAEASGYATAYHCDGIAREPSILLTIPVSLFHARLERDSSLSRIWAAHLAHALQAARMQAEIRTLRTVSERLDAWLAEAQPLPPKGQWQDLAQTLGVTREALYRELGKRRI